MNDNRSEWQRRIGVGEPQHRPKLLRSTVETAENGVSKERVEYTDGRVDNFYTIPTAEVVTTCQLG
jgi:hypothetical protein